MSLMVKCSLCERSTVSTDNTQDISLQVDEEANSSLEDSLHDFFQSEILERENAYWCDTSKKTCRATKTHSYTRMLAILIIHLKRLILGEKIQTHTPFGTTLDLEPYMTPRPPQPHGLELVGIISHYGTKDNGHYTAITRRGDEWTLFNGISSMMPLWYKLRGNKYIKHRRTFWCHDWKENRT